MSTKPWQKIYADFNSSPRKYASFFHAPRKYRPTQELVIAQKVYSSLENTEIHFDYQINKKDPPDIIVTSNDGNKIGVEVTELVSEAAIKAQIQGDRESELKEMLGWDQDKIFNSILQIIKDKSNIESPITSQYDQYVLIIHTAEPKLSIDMVRTATKDLKRDIISPINECYILSSSCNPKTKSNQILKLF